MKKIIISISLLGLAACATDGEPCGMRGDCDFTMPVGVTTGPKGGQTVWRDQPDIYIATPSFRQIVVVRDVPVITETETTTVTTTNAADMGIGEDSIDAIADSVNSISEKIILTGQKFMIPENLPPMQETDKPRAPAKK